MGEEGLGGGELSIKKKNLDGGTGKGRQQKFPGQSDRSKTRAGGH